MRAVGAGESRVLVLHGEAGVGKTALLEYLAGHATGCQVARVVGVQSEMELPFAGLHQLCGPVLEHLEALPVPQRDALRTTFGLSTGPAPDRFLVGLAVLSLLSQVAGQSPLLCIIDDFQWLDRTSAQVLAFAARRLGAESVGMVLATRAHSEDLAGLPDLTVAGLRAADAQVLLDATRPGTRRWSGGRPPGSGSARRRRCRPSTRAWPSSAQGWCSAIRLPARRPTSR